MYQVDYNADGVISYHEFAPLCYDLLVEVVNLEIQRNQVEAAEEEAIAEARMLEVCGHLLFPLARRATINLQGRCAHVWFSVF